MRWTLVAAGGAIVGVLLGSSNVAPGVGAQARAGPPRVEAGSATGRLPPPPVPLKGPPGWCVEHVAFALGNSGKVVGGPARWAISGGLPSCAVPAEQAGRLYSERPGERLYFSDQRRHVWVLEDGETWPVAGTDGQGEEDGPGSYASFVYTGVYGGHHDGMVAAGETVYLLDNGRLRRIRRDPDKRWQVETVSGRAPETSSPEAGATLTELSNLGKGLAMDPKGNLYFTLEGGLLRAAPDGAVTQVITAEKASAELAEIYRQKWPGAEARGVSLGVGEGVHLVYHPSGDVYGLGRTWPNAWKVTPQGRFVPLVGYGPAEKIHAHRWGPGNPALYQVHCPMGCPGVSPEGYPVVQNEIPYVAARYEPDQVVVLRKDGTWGLIPPESHDFYRFNTGHPGFYADGTVQNAAPGPFPSGSMWIRLRKEN